MKYRVVQNSANWFEVQVYSFPFWSDLRSYITPGEAIDEAKRLALIDRQRKQKGTIIFEIKG